MKEELIRFGKIVVSQGLTHSVFGNMSLLEGDTILITRTGSMLDYLEDDIISVPLFAYPENHPEASSDLDLHMAIYHNSKARAIIHGHTTYATILSIEDSSPFIVPCDMEGRLVFNKVPFLPGELPRKELALAIGSMAKEVKALIIRGHGPFAWGKDIKEAFVRLSALEHSCKLLFNLRLLKR